MDNEKMKEVLERMKMNRPKFPKRAVVTAGMPYGSKNLHYGHVCGMMVYADFFARFLHSASRIVKNLYFFKGTKTLRLCGTKYFQNKIFKYFVNVTT